MNTADIVFLALVGCGGILGAIRGTAREVASLLHVLGAAALARVLLPQTLPLARKLYDFAPGDAQELVAWTCGFLLLYLFLLGLLTLARPLFRRLRHPPGRLLGLLFGITRTAVLLALLLPLALWIAPDGGSARRQLSGAGAMRAVRQAARLGPAGYLVPAGFLTALPREPAP